MSHRGDRSAGGGGGGHASGGGGHAHAGHSKSAANSNGHSGPAAAAAAVPLSSRQSPAKDKKGGLLKQLGSYLQSPASALRSAANFFGANPPPPAGFTLTRKRSSDRSSRSRDTSDGEDDSQDEGPAAAVRGRQQQAAHFQLHTPPLRPAKTPAKQQHSAHTPLKLAAAAAAAPSAAKAKFAAAAASAAAAEGAPVVTAFNGNQWMDRHGNKKEKEASAKRPKPGKLSSKPNKAPRLPSSSPPPAASAAAASAAPAAAASSSRKPLPSPIALKPSSSTPALSRRVNGSSHPGTPLPTPTTNLASTTFSSPFFRHTTASPLPGQESVLHMLLPAAAAAASENACVLPPHPMHSVSSGGVYGRSGSSSSSAIATPRKRARTVPTVEESPRHTNAFHSAALSSSHSQPAPTYIHFRSRFKGKPAPSAHRVKSKNLHSQLNAAAAASPHSSTAASNALFDSLMQQRRGRPILNVGAGATVAAASSTSAPPPKGKRKSLTDEPLYSELRRQSLAAHTSSQPANADWLWHSLQHRGAFSSVDTCAAAMSDGDAAPSAAASSAAAASSSSFFSSAAGVSPLSPFFASLPLHQSSIKPYFLFQDCDEGSLRLFTGLRSLVRYHRIRGLAVPGQKKKSKSTARADDILEFLFQLADSARSDDDEDSMDVSDGPHSRARGASAATAASSSASPARSHLLSMLHDTRLIPSSLNTPCAVLNETNASFFTVPLCTQLLITKFHAVMPAVWAKEIAHKLKPKQMALAQAPPGLKLHPSLAPQAGEEEWLEKSARALPETHRRLVPLFYLHVVLPSKDAAAASSAAAPLPPLQDALYHFNLTSFSSSLLYHLYQNTLCHKFLLTIDPLADRLPSYHRDQVKNPMSMYDIDVRVVCGYYDSPLEVLSDLWRCFENTLLFHSKKFHRHENESKLEAEERSSHEGEQLTRGMVEEVAKIWREVRIFVDKYFTVFMTHAPSAGLTSPRCTAMQVAATLQQLRVWMDEVISREVQTLKLIWIARREVEQPFGRFLAQPVSQWQEYQPPSAHAADDDGDEPAHKKQKLSASSAKKARRFRPESPLRPTRLHPVSGLELSVNPHAAFPPLHHSRTHGGKHAANLPTQLVRKLARRGGRIPASWGVRWFYLAKKQ